MPYSLRPASLEDAPAITGLLNAIDVIEVGRPETDQHTVEADLKHPDADLARDSWLAFDGERLVVYGLLWDESGGERIDMDHYVLPEHQEAGLAVLAAMEDRALERARENGAARAVVHLYLNVDCTMDTDLLAARGWGVVRRYHVLHRPLDADRDGPVEFPAGVTLRSCVTEDDRRTVHALYQTTFAEHFDHQPRTYEQWLNDIDADNVDWSLVWIASTTEAGAAVARDVAFLIARNDRTAMGWIRSLGVLREARGRGLAGLLLRHSFATFAALGRDTVGLGVDTDNTTGAPALYARHGMTVHFAVDTWEVTLT
ncbi:GNAT family N-acetyltransferase [Streptomyces roseirectus]|uniref:GNAT family N-acetyltransferase n=1 Tax=Streptomyces roseirectus TaxID=2768066 RepID=A0A7H0IPB4_9ACTN|nr:GNAT family N-acetyltransferase [Streptomyces roseirectus]QNP74630.1 GNAT family N-acetyltransferase [Streptomyces roseirectus]